MELQGETYLFNLSLIAITFTAVSALVMLMRQTMGGRLSNFDVYLTTSFISFGFAIAISAILPPLIFFFEFPAYILWAISSIISAAALSAVLASNVHRRKIVASEPMSFAVIGSFSAQAFSVIILLINATIQPWQGIHLFASALTISISVLMWFFVRRIASLVGDKPGEDWDPKRG